MYGKYGDMMKAFFSDRHYVLKVALLTAGVFLLCSYSFYKGQRIQLTVEECLANPEAYHGEEVFLYKVYVKKLEEEGFWVVPSGRAIFVEGHMDGLETGDCVDISTRFNRGGHLALDWGRVIRYRPIKLAVSGLAAVGVVCLFFKRFRLDPRKYHVFYPRGGL